MPSSQGLTLSAVLCCQLLSPIMACQVTVLLLLCVGLQHLFTTGLEPIKDVHITYPKTADVKHHSFKPDEVRARVEHCWHWQRLHA